MNEEDIYNFTLWHIFGAIRRIIDKKLEAINLPNSTFLTYVLSEQQFYNFKEYKFKLDIFNIFPIEFSYLKILIFDDNANPRVLIRSGVGKWPEVLYAKNQFTFDIDGVFCTQELCKFLLENDDEFKIIYLTYLDIFNDVCNEKYIKNF